MLGSARGLLSELLALGSPRQNIGFHRGSVVFFCLFPSELLFYDSLVILTCLVTCNYYSSKNVSISTQFDVRRRFAIIEVLMIRVFNCDIIWISMAYRARQLQLLINQERSVSAALDLTQTSGCRRYRAY